MSQNLNFIALHYGFNSQSQVFIEEMSELTKALCKYNRATDVVDKAQLWNEIEEELADVLVLANQFLEVWADEENVKAIAESKIERQLTRIMEETKKC